MPKLSSTQRQFLREATSKYHASLPGSPADEHLAGRGLYPSDRVRREVEKFRLGYVADPLPGHDMYRGMLAIPYLRRSEERDENGDRTWSTVSMRFRCLIPDCEHNGHGKYMTTEGDRPRLFNTVALLRGSDNMLICEGEIDAITAQAYGYDAIAVPGASSWQKHFGEPLLGYESVFIMADGDKAGMDFARKVRQFLPNGRIIPCPPGEDVNSWITNPDGFNAFKERVK